MLATEAKAPALCGKSNGLLNCSSTRIAVVRAYKCILPVYVLKSYCHSESLVLFKTYMDFCSSMVPL